MFIVEITRYEKSVADHLAKTISEIIGAWWERASPQILKERFKFYTNIETE